MTVTLTDRRPFTVYLGSLGSVSSRRTVNGCLTKIAALYPKAADNWENLRYEDTSAIRELLLRQGWAGATVNKHINTLKGILREAWTLKLMTAEQYHDAARIKPVEENRLPTGQHIATDRLTVGLKAALDDPRDIGIRDAAIIALMYRTGLRAAELAGLRLEDYADGALRVYGKRGHVRSVPVADEAASLLERWLEVRGTRAGALFIATAYTGMVYRATARYTKLSTQSITNALERRVGADVNPHDLRRTFIGELLEKVDVVTVSRLAGHSSPATTARYDRRPEARSREAVNALPSLL